VGGIKDEIQTDIALLEITEFINDWKCTNCNILYDENILFGLIRKRVD
jgi:hypothetical protein